MLRRLFLTAFAPKLPSRAPDDAVAMNTFAAEYNKYVMQLHAGFRDVKLWERVLRAWERL